METHPDQDATSEVFKRLEERMERMNAEGSNRITAGAPGEKPLREWQIGSFAIKRMPDDPDALRISVGVVLKDRHHQVDETSYLVYRGDSMMALCVLRDAVVALEEALRK